MSVVLGDDDLLREILLGLGLPTSLLRAALVCRRWYRVASDPGFLRRFRDRHPPRILGVYLNTLGSLRSRFFPIRPLQELATVVSRVGSFFDTFPVSSTLVNASRGGRLLITAYGDEVDEYGYYHSTHLFCNPLSTVGNAVVVPPSPEPTLLSVGMVTSSWSLPDGDNGRSCLCVMRCTMQQVTVSLYELQDACWVARESVAAQLYVLPRRFNTLFDGSKFYMWNSINETLVCDFPSSSISTMELPDGVENVGSQSIMLSRREGSGIYLIHVKKSLLRVFHNDNKGRWFLVHSICLREVCSNLGITDWPSLDGHTRGVKIHAAGDNAKFVILEMFGTTVFLDITSKQAEKVYEMTTQDELVSVHPLMLTWPLVFPQLKES